MKQVLAGDKVAGQTHTKTKTNSRDTTRLIQRGTRLISFYNTGSWEPKVIKGSTKYGPRGGCSASLLENTGLPEGRRRSLASYINQGLAQKTWSSYKTAERMWRKCEKETGTKLELPWEQKQTLMFLDWLLTDRKVSAATASSYLAGMAKLHEIRGLEEPKLRKGLVCQVLKGKKNAEAVEKRNKEDKGRLPVTLTIMKLLKEEVRALKQPLDNKLLLWAVSTLAFHGSFRIHEILCQNETFFDPDFVLLGKDVKTSIFRGETGQQTKVLHVTLKCPKESRKAGVTIVDIYETGGPTCPIKAFDRWSMRNSREDDKILFRYKEGIPLTGRRFNVLLKTMLGKHIDYKKGQITAHSFRSGIPSLLGSLGHTDEEIKKMGRWSSRSFEFYTKLPRTSRAAMAQKLGKL